jgi:DNA-binding NarL/FixJ family response regulator
MAADAAWEAAATGTVAGRSTLEAESKTTKRPKSSLRSPGGSSGQEEDLHGGLRAAGIRGCAGESQTMSVREGRSMSAIAVRVFASHPLAASTYARIISAEKDFRLVAGDGPNAGEPFEVGIFDCASEFVDVVVADARRCSPSMHALVLADSIDENQCLRWILSGVRGVVTYDQIEAQLTRAIRHLAQDQIWFPAQVALRWMLMEPGAAPSSLPGGLTRRETEIVRLLSSRLSNKEIAGLLNVSERTVKFHATNIYSKLKIGSRQELSSLPLARSAAA